MMLLSGFFMIVGGFFIFIAGLGLVRFPDVYMRMHAVSKSMSMGMGSLLVAAMIEFASWGVIVKSILIILFLFLTIPVASQIISRAAYLMKVPLWKDTVINEYHDITQPET